MTGEKNGIKRCAFSLGIAKENRAKRPGPTNQRGYGLAASIFCDFCEGCSFSSAWFADMSVAPQALTFSSAMTPRLYRLENQIYFDCPSLRLSDVHVDLGCTLVRSPLMHQKTATPSLWHTNGTLHCEASADYLPWTYRSSYLLRGGRDYEEMIPHTSSSTSIIRENSSKRSQACWVRNASIMSKVADADLGGWTFRIVFTFSARGRGRGQSEAPGGGGETFYWKSQEGGGGSPGRVGAARGREGVCGEFGGGGCGIFFFSGPKSPPRVDQNTNSPTDLDLQSVISAISVLRGR